MEDLKKLIREIPDYPKPGILFYDITTLLKDKKGFHMMIDRLCGHYEGHTIDMVAGIEARGFIFGAGAGVPLECGICAGAQAEQTAFEDGEDSYALEYGTDSMEVHEDAVQKGQRVLLCDDLLANGRHRRGRSATDPLAGRSGGRRGLCGGAEFLEGAGEAAGD